MVQLKIFISHSSKDEDLYNNLADSLKRQGYLVLHAVAIDAGEIWIEKIKKELQDSDILIAIITDNFLSSSWAQVELSSAILGINNIRVLPVVVGDVFIPYFLAQFQYIKVKTKDEISYAVLRIIAKLNDVKDNPMRGVNNIMLINIDSSSLIFGVSLGFKLSRLEWLWGSNYDFAKDQFLPSKKEVLSLLPLGEINIDESNYESFTQSILGFYQRTDIEIYSAILIGVTIQRCSLIGASKDDKYNLELQLLAKSSLQSIPSKIIPQKEKLFSIILKHKNDNLFTIIDILETYNDTNSFSNLNIPKPKLFLSYCSQDQCIADIVEKTLITETNNNIDISRYTRLPYHESFKKFMNSIQEHDFVLCIVSDSYLKSQACMYEVGEIIKDHNYSQKLLFVVLGENDYKFYPDSDKKLVVANIYNDEIKKLEYVSFWKKKYDALEDKIRSLNDPEATNHSTKNLNEIGRIYRNDISEFLDFLSEYNGKSFGELYSNKFFDIISWILPNWESNLFEECSNYRELFNEAIQAIIKVTGTDYNQIALVSRRNNYESSLMVFADNVSKHKQQYRVVIMEGLMGKVFSNGQLQNIGDVSKEPDYFPAVLETKSEAIIPILYLGNTIGVINSESEEKNHYTEDDINRLVKIANCLSVALHRIGYTANIPCDKIPYEHRDYIMQ